MHGIKIAQAFASSSSETDLYKWLMAEKLHSCQTLTILKKTVRKERNRDLKKRDFLLIHMVPPSITKLFLKGLVENHNFYATKAE